MENKICPICNKEFSKPNNESKFNWFFRHKYCSKECRNKSKKGKVSPKKGKPSGMIPWNKGKKLGKSPKNTRIEKECLQCGKIFIIGKYRKDSAKFCSKECANENMNKGKRSANKIDRQSLEYKLWRKSCFERDNFICQKTGQIGGKLVVHHINNFADFPELRFAIDNGITLSEKAHKEFHKKYGQRNNTKGQLEEFLAVNVLA
jgi:hypothetical protein